MALVTTRRAIGDWDYGRGLPGLLWFNTFDAGRIRKKLCRLITLILRQAGHGEKSQRHQRRNAE
jgi:hypothetical protein